MAARGVTPMTAALRGTLAAHGVARRTGIPVEEVLGVGTASATAGPTRRDVLKAAGAVVAGATVVGSMPARRANAATNPSVLVVGAGLAGLRAAHYLWRVKGIAAAVYEGSNRAGDRCYSLRDYFPGLVVEHGGQLINTDHNAIRNLASSLGLGREGGGTQGRVVRGRGRP
jgi:monoamine oxidase